jgi:hypothetical protein
MMPPLTILVCSKSFKGAVGARFNDAIVYVQITVGFVAIVNQYKGPIRERIRKHRTLHLTISGRHTVYPQGSGTEHTGPVVVEVACWIVNSIPQQLVGYVRRFVFLTIHVEKKNYGGEKKDDKPADSERDDCQDSQHSPHYLFFPVQQSVSSIKAGGIAKIPGTLPILWIARKPSRGICPIIAIRSGVLHDTDVLISPSHLTDKNNL